MTDILHICLSGNPACSGINPCDACHHVYTTRILPRAMVMGGFNGSRAQSQAFFAGYKQARQEVLHNLAAQLQAQAPTLNGAEPPPEVAPPDDGQWQEGGPALTDEEVARMAIPPPPDFAPEPDEDVGMPDEDRAKEVAEALLQGKPLTRKEDSPPPAGPAAEETTTLAPRQASPVENPGEAVTASKE